MGQRIKDLWRNRDLLALLIRTESRNPDAPSNAPAMISTLLPSAKPVALEANPA